MKVKLIDVVDALDLTDGEKEHYYRIADGAVIDDLDGGLENCIPLPGKEDIKDYRMMQYFIYGLEDEKLQDELLHEIQGAGAFKRFRDAIAKHKLKNAWYRYKREELEDIARRWCVDNDIDYE